MTAYLKKYMEELQRRLEEYADKAELEEIFQEHKDKIAFMQHERIVHFLVTMMFAIVLAIFVCAFLFTENPALMLLVMIIMVLLGFYIKHYYFLENTVQEMYKIYDKMLILRRKEADSNDEKGNSTACL
jgi:fatty acid desaturase